MEFIDTWSHPRIYIRNKFWNSIFVHSWNYVHTNLFKKTWQFANSTVFLENHISTRKEVILSGVYWLLTMVDCIILSGFAGKDSCVELPIQFTAKDPGHYPCQIELCAPDDVRVYKVECTVNPEGSTAELEFKAPVHQSVTQEIPIVSLLEPSNCLKMRFFQNAHSKWFIIWHKKILTKLW